MDLLQQIVARAKADKQRIVLPEAEEERTLKAADKVLADDIADIILIGNPANIKNLQHSGVLITSTRLLLLIRKTILRLRSMQRSSLNFERRRA